MSSAATGWRACVSRAFILRQQYDVMRCLRKSQSLRTAGVSSTGNRTVNSTSLLPALVAFVAFMLPGPYRSEILPPAVTAAVVKALLAVLLLGAEVAELAPPPPILVCGYACRACMWHDGKKAMSKAVRVDKPIRSAGSTREP